MKKILFLTFCCILMVVMVLHAIPAMADVSFEGEYRVRAYSYDLSPQKREDNGKSFDNSQTYYDQRFRLQMTAAVNENLKGVLRLVAPQNSGKIWGYSKKWDDCEYSGNECDPEENPTAEGVEIDLAYIDFTIPNTKFNCVIGKQYLSLGNYIVLGSQATYDAILVNAKLGIVDLSVFTAKLYEGDISDSPSYVSNQDPSYMFSEDDEDLYGVALGFNAAPNMNFGLFLVKVDDSDVGSGFFTDDIDTELWQDLDAYYIGLTANMDFAPVKIKAELDYCTGKIAKMENSAADDDIKIKGLAFFADVCADLSPFKVGGSILYTTGNDKEDMEKNEFGRFEPISSSFSYMNDWDSFVLYHYLHEDISNLTALRVFGMWDITQKTALKGSIINFNRTEDEDDIEDIKTALGTELNLKVEHSLYENLTVSGGFSYWMTSKETFPQYNDNGEIEDPDGCMLFKAQVLYTF